MRGTTNGLRGEYFQCWSPSALVVMFGITDVSLAMEQTANPPGRLHVCGATHLGSGLKNASLRALLRCIYHVCLKIFTISVCLYVCVCERESARDTRVWVFKASG